MTSPAWPYVRLMRLHQPVGIWLLLWPCWWALALASPGLPSLYSLCLFAVGATLMRAAGCIINDMADRHFDRQVERTKTRPLACGELTMRQAALLLFLLLACALLVALQLGAAALLWATLSLAPVAVYPFMKRISWWPQLFLGLTFNWGALIGWAAARGAIEWPALLLYIGGIGWTLGYDTIYAHQDKADDARIGVKSTALRLGRHTTPAVAGFYALAIACWFAAISSSAIESAAPYLALLAAAAHFTWQVRALRTDDPASCRRIFRSNAWPGLLIFIACLHTG